MLEMNVHGTIFKYGTIMYEVSLEGQGLLTIPEYIFNMPNLEVLHMDNNNLTRLPERVGTLKKLILLDLDGNGLKTLPESIGKLTRLEELYMYDNKLTRLPESIGNLKQLDKLILENNNLTSLPESIGNLKNLRILRLSNNALKSLPESIGKLKKLQSLVVTNNPLQSVPESLKTLSQSRLKIIYGNNTYSVNAFVQLFANRRKMRVNNTTNSFNRSIMEARLSNVSPNKRAFINNKANVKNNGTLRRVYNINGLMGYMSGRTYGRLHGNVFTANKITLLKNVPHNINKSAHLRNIKNRLVNTPVNNMTNVIRAAMKVLPADDVNRLVKNRLDV